MSAQDGKGTGSQVPGAEDHQTKCSGISNGPPASTRLYKRRWVMVFLFSFYSMSNAYQWIQYGIINNIMMKFYNVDSFLIDCMSLLYMLAYIPFIFPVTCLLDKKGLRVTALLANALNLVGTWVKVVSAKPDLFWVTVLGQASSALAQVFILGMPSRLASVWFGPNEVSTACSIGVFGNQTLGMYFLLSSASGSNLISSHNQEYYATTPRPKSRITLSNMKTVSKKLKLVVCPFNKIK